MIDYPHFCIGAKRNCHRFKANRHTGDMREAEIIDSKISTVLSGVLTAANRSPFGDVASGRNWALSKLTKSCATTAPGMSKTIAQKKR